MRLTQRQRTTFNAALCLIHDLGHDVNAVTADASARIGTGTPAHLAYQRALDAFVSRTPDMLAPLQQVVRLIDASDDRTVAGYGVALSHYIASGDDGQLRALAPNIALDMAELAARNGEEVPPESQNFVSGETTGNAGEASDAAEAATFQFTANAAVTLP